MITPRMIEDAYKDGVIELIKSPHNDGTVCKIGESWFYFGGITAEEYDNPDDYKHDIPEEVIVNDIFETLDGLKRCGYEFEDEYWYYYGYLTRKDMVSNEQQMD